MVVPLFLYRKLRFFRNEKTQEFIERMLDENKSNNNINNLEWCTSKYNINYGTCL